MEQPGIAKVPCPWQGMELGDFFKVNKKVFKHKKTTEKSDSYGKDRRGKQVSVGIFNIIINCQSSGGTYWSVRRNSSKFLFQMAQNLCHFQGTNQQWFCNPKAPRAMNHPFSNRVKKKTYKHYLCFTYIQFLIFLALLCLKIS